MPLETSHSVRLPAFASSFLPHPIPHAASVPSRFVCAARDSPQHDMAVKRGKIPGYVRPIVPAKPLHHFVEDKAQSRADVSKAICAYAKEHNLQDPNDGRIIYCDDVLRSALGVDQCTVLEVLKYATPHFIKPEQLGGRYIQEAIAIERAFLDGQPSDGTQKKKTRTKSQARKQTAEEDRKAGRHLFRPMCLTPELAAVCRAPELTRHEVVKAVWEYIHMNNLQGQGPPERPIRCDFLLRKVFNADCINVRTVMSGISPHMRKKE
ncbi:unnamed protein product [Agarophyton chilense]